MSFWTGLNPRSSKINDTATTSKSGIDLVNDAFFPPGRLDVLGSFHDLIAVFELISTKSLKENP